jgi:cytochrome c peroxidase
VDPLWSHAPYFHDGSAATLEDAVEHYGSDHRLHLIPRQKQDLAGFLKSI